MTATSAEELLDVLEAFIGRLHCGAQSAGLEAMLAADLTFSQMRTLLTLVQQPEPAPIHQIAGRLGLSVAAAGRNVDQLVRTGLVGRVEDELDRRIKRISLTAAGFDLIATVKDDQRRFALDLLAGVDEQDARRLIDAIRPIVTKFGCTGRGHWEASTSPTESPTESPAESPTEKPHEHRQEIPV